MIEGVDYSATAWSQSPSVAALNDAGLKFVGRYAVGDKSPSGRGITAAEYQRMTAGGIDVFLYWQTTTSWMLGGFNAGVNGAKNAQLNISGAGMPEDTPVYFAVDFDAQLWQMPAIHDCLRGCASVLGEDRVGVYGGWLVMDEVSKENTAKWFCQTLAWMYGRGWHPRAHLHQYGFNYWLDGTNCDRVRATVENYGQAIPPLVPVPIPEDPYTDPVVPPWFWDSLDEENPTDRTWNGFKYKVARRNFIASEETGRYSEPRSHAPRSGTNVDRREKIFGERYVQKIGQKRYWILDEKGHYIAGGKLDPGITIEL